MNTKLHLLLVAALGLSLAACSQKEEGGVQAPHAIQVLGEDAFHVPYQETILDVEVEANCKWSVSKTNDAGEALSWIKTDVPNSAASGSRKFRILVLENDTDKSRAGTVTIFSDQVSAFIDITQDANPDPGHEPEPFRGYSIPVYEWFGGSSASVSDKALKFEGGLSIEKTSGSDISVSAVESVLLPGFSIALGSGDGLIFKIPLTYPTSGDYRFTYGSANENITSAEAYQWSSDEGLTWNPVTKFEVSGISAFRSIWLSISEAKTIGPEGWLWINAQESAASVSLVGGVALTKSNAATSSLEPEDNETVVISEGFDNTADAHAAYLTAPSYMRDIAGNAWVSANDAITATNSFERPGFIQVGAYDDAAPADAKAGTLTLNVGKRLQSMGISEETTLTVAFRAAGVRFAIKSGENELAQVTNLALDRLNDFAYSIQKADQSTVLTFTSLETTGDTRFFIDDLLVTVYKVPIPTGPVELEFDFSKADDMIDWNLVEAPEVSSKDYIFESSVKLNGTLYTFKGAQPKDLEDGAKNLYPYYSASGNKVVIPTDRYLSLPAIPGLKLTKVECYRNVGKSPQMGITDGVYGGASDDSKVFVAEVQATTNKAWNTWTLTNTEAGKVYWLYATTAYMAFEKLKLYYEP